MSNSVNLFDLIGNAIIIVRLNVRL